MIGPAPLNRGELGSGGVLALTVLALVAVLALAVTGVGVALAERQRIVAAADAAALAAADTAVGIHPGMPCSAARAVAAAHGARLTACELDGVVATVEATARIAGVPVSVRARAGPPR